MELKDVVAFIDENKENEEVSTWLKGFEKQVDLNGDVILDFINKSQENKQVIQPLIDKAVTQAVKTRDKAHEGILETEVKKRVAAELLKLNPSEEPWQKEIRELKEQNENEKKERAKDNLKRQIVEEAARLKIDPFFIEDYLPNSFDEAIIYLKKIQDYSKKVVEATTQNLLAQGFKPGASANTDMKNKIKASEYRKLPQAERVEMLQKGIEVIPD